jgi:hypothetical protein
MRMGQPRNISHGTFNCKQKDINETIELLRTMVFVPGWSDPVHKTRMVGGARRRRRRRFAAHRAAALLTPVTLSERAARMLAGRILGLTTSLVPPPPPAVQRQARLRRCLCAAPALPAQRHLLHQGGRGGLAAGRGAGA